jgi:hypothetical protein
MKPALPKIDPAKRTAVPPEPEFSPQEALKIVRVFVIALVVPLVFQIVAWFTPTQTNLAAACVRSGMQFVPAAPPRNMPAHCSSRSRASTVVAFTQFSDCAPVT